MINSCKNNPSTAREIPIADLHKTFNEQIATLDPQRAQSVTDLSTLRSTKSTTLTHQQNLLTRKLGAGNPRIAALAQQQTRNAALQTALTAETTRAQTPAPTVSAHGYVFHGYVLDANRQPLPKLSVALYDDEGKWFSQLGYGCTDDKGYFIMCYDRAVEPKPKPAPSPQPVPAPQPAPVPQPSTKLFGAAETNVVTPIDVVVQKPNSQTFALNILVFDQQQKLLYRDPNPLQPRLGHVDYRVIIIGGDNAGTCTPPPDSASTSGTCDEKTGATTGATTSIRDIASLRKQAAPQSQVSARAAVPARVAPASAAMKKKSGTVATAIKLTTSRKKTKKSAASPKRKSPPRKKKKSK